jgi:hypothetical protein
LPRALLPSSKALLPSATELSKREKKKKKKKKPATFFYSRFSTHEERKKTKEWQRAKVPP